LLKPGDTFFLNDATSPGDGHLYFVACVDPVEGALILNFTTHKPGGDESRTFEASEHEWMKWKTRVGYEYAQIKNAEEFERLEKSEIDRKLAALTPQQLRKIQQRGISADDSTARMIRMFSRALNPSPPSAPSQPSGR